MIVDAQYADREFECALFQNDDFWTRKNRCKKMLLNYKLSGREYESSWEMAGCIYRGLQMYASDPNYPAESLIEFLQTVDYNMINGSGELLDKIARTEYARQRLSCETGYVMELGNLIWEENKEITAHIQNARDDQYAQIARFICSDEELGGHYRPQDLEKQLLERKAEKFGRNKILLLDGEIVRHIAIYAETDEAAIHA